MSTSKTTDTADALKGSVEEAIGKLIGDGKAEAEGKAQKHQVRPSKAEARGD